jgi:integrase
MRGQPAKILGRSEVRAALGAARKHRHADRDQAIILLSVKAGLRACEIAALTWTMVTDAHGRVGRVLELPARAAKVGSGRRIPMHADLRRALNRLARTRHERDGSVIRSERSGAMSAKAIVNWFTLLYRELGLNGCSSHSGRRTFVTEAARLIHRAGGSLRDVQQLAGHRSIKTTEGYIEGSGEAQRRLMRLL